MKRFTQLVMAFAISTLIAQLMFAQSSSLSTHDRLKIAAQKICPVSGKPLGSMGTPPKVKVGAEEIFLCCKSCQKGQIDKEHWATIHANFAKAQGKCPVMEKGLPTKAKWTIVEGQLIYICCPPCAKKIQADPDTYLAKVDAYYQDSLGARPDSTTASRAPDSDDSAVALNPFKPDQLKIAVQKICPVSGNSLGSMGSPFKVNAGGMDLFLCCEGCREGKVNKEHWTTILDNFAKAQGVCPVMEKELPKNAKSTVVDGQIVFVCCPPCTKKIAKEPAKFRSKVDTYYMASLNEPSKSTTRQ